LSGAKRLSLGNTSPADTVTDWRNLYLLPLAANGVQAYFSEKHNTRNPE
jgi:hypothetical protein